MSENQRKVEDQPQRESAARYKEGTLGAFYDAFKIAGIDFVVFLPDSLLDGLEQMILQRKEIETFQCAREDEGIGIAMGAFLVERPHKRFEGVGRLAGVLGGIAFAGIGLVGAWELFRSGIAGL